MRWLAFVATALFAWPAGGEPWPRDDNVLRWYGPFGFNTPTVNQCVIMDTGHGTTDTCGIGVEQAVPVYKPQGVVIQDFWCTSEPRAWGDASAGDDDGSITLNLIWMDSEAALSSSSTQVGVSLVLTSSSTVASNGIRTTVSSDTPKSINETNGSLAILVTAENRSDGVVSANCWIGVN